MKEVLSEPLMASWHLRAASSSLHPTTSLPLIGLPAKGKDWPSEVFSLLRPRAEKRPARRGTPVRAEPPTTSALRLHCGAFQLPHPRKADLGGEDSFFICSGGSAAGVADGVGEWAWRFGLNPRAFADELMAGACCAAERTRGDSSRSGKDRAAFAMSEGFGQAKSFGSSTALVVALDAAGRELGVANLGDSGMRQIRSVRHHDRACHVQGRTTEQQHSFNCPYQLALLPSAADFPRLRKERKFALVRAVQNAPASQQDTPSNADLYSLPVQEGDLILLGTDGVFDNLHDWEVCLLAECAASPFEASQALDPDTGELVGRPLSCDGSTDPSDLAEAIAKAAFARSIDPTARTPFGANAKEAGLHCLGGKMDDISVVAAWVVRTTASDNSSGREAVPP